MAGSENESAPLPDQDARQAICEDLDTTILVEAAAGTGKTESLVQRMVALVRTGKATVERISAVTFTIKAAAELSQRFQTRLEEAARTAGPEERPRFEDALVRLDAAFIGTIHAFCARLLRERPVEAGVDPDFAEMDQPEDAVARREAWDRYTEKLFTSDDPILTRLSALGVRLDDLRQTFETLSENEDVVPASTVEPAPPDFLAQRRALADFLERAAKELPSDTPPEGWNDFQEGVRRALRLEKLLDPADPASFVRAAEALCRVSGKAKEAGALRSRFETLVAEVLEPAINTWHEHLHPILMSAIVPAVRDYAAWRRRNGRLNFQDLLLYARDLLRDHPVVRRAFQERFLPILVDEFQDTDPIQAEILLYLTGRETDGKDWRVLTPAPGSLFVVGDPKQSIYRFRRADIETYNFVRGRIEGSGRILALTTNFRSTGRLCAFVNTAFRTLFPAVATREQAADVPLEARREEGGPAAFRLEVRTDTPSSDAVVAQDSERIARAIADAVASGERRPGDFLVLFRYRYRMADYARALEARGLPYELAGGGAFQDSEELAVLLTLLEAVADPDNPVPFTAALRGPLFGVDDEALYRHFASGGRFSFRAAPPPGADPRIAAACAMLTEAASLAATLPPGAAIARIAEKLGWLALSAARELGDSRAGNLLKAVAAARTFAGEGLDFTAAVEELAQMTREGYIEEMSVSPGRRDVVRLLTVHGAKGLEAPVVFLADPRSERGKPPRAWSDRSGTTAVGYWRIVRETDDHHVIEFARPARWETMAAREKEFEEADKHRLLYVASTRARDMLVVSTWRQGKGKPKGPWCALDPFLAESLPETGGGAVAVPVEPPSEGALSAELADFRKLRSARREAVEAPTYRVVPVTDIVHAASEKPAWEHTGRGMSWGRVLHAVLEAAMRDETLDLSPFAANVLAEEERPAGDLEEVVRVVEAVRASPLWARARQAKQRLVEVPFALRVTPEEIGLADGPEGTLLQGAIDLVFEEEDGWVLVDYKSDTVGKNRDSLVRFYAPQVTLYSRYWERLTGRPTRAGLFFVTTGETVWVPAAAAVPGNTL